MKKTTKKPGRKATKPGRKSAKGKLGSKPKTSKPRRATSAAAVSP